MAEMIAAILGGTALAALINQLGESRRLKAVTREHARHMQAIWAARAAA